MNYGGSQMARHFLSRFSRVIQQAPAGVAAIHLKAVAATFDFNYR
jgi:hypothetical protein